MRSYRVSRSPVNGNCSLNKNVSYCLEHGKNKSHQTAAPCYKNFVFQLWGQSWPSNVLSSLTKMCIFVTRGFRRSEILKPHDSEGWGGIWRVPCVPHSVGSCRAACTFPGQTGGSGPASSGLHVCAKGPALCWHSWWPREDTSVPASTLSLSSSQTTQRTDSSTVCFSRVARKIYALLYFVLIEIKQTFPGLGAWAFVIMHKTQDRRIFNLDGLAGLSLACFFSEGRKGPNSPQSY